MMPPTSPRSTIAIVLACCAPLAACGGGTGGDGGRAAAEVPVRVTASFPARQAVSAGRTLRITVRNTGGRTADAVAVVLAGLDRPLAHETGVADRRRPVWIVDRAPDGGASFATDTWEVGALPPGASRTYRWTLTPAALGRHELRWRVSAGVGADVAVREARGVLPVVVGDGR